MNRLLISRFIPFASLLPVLLNAEILDTFSFWNDALESLDNLSSTHSDFKSGGRGEPSRRLYPGGDVAWQGGGMKFIVRVDPPKPNSLSFVRLSGVPVLTSSNAKDRHIVAAD
jgi:hypothetical protein